MSFVSPYRFEAQLRVPVSHRNGYLALLKDIFDGQYYFTMPAANDGFSIMTRHELVSLANGILHWDKRQRDKEVLIGQEGRAQAGEISSPAAQDSEAGSGGGNLSGGSGSDRGIDAGESAGPAQEIEVVPDVEC